MLASRHSIASLGLLGPPASKTGWDTTAKLSTWDHVGSYDSAQECDRAKGEQQTLPPPEVRVPADRRRQAWAADDRCIATDDPRLAK
jgi:hypothetical protein